MAVQGVSYNQSFKGKVIPIQIWQKTKKLNQIAHQIAEMKIVKNSDLKVYLFQSGVTVKRGKLSDRTMEASVDTVFNSGALVSATKRAIAQFHRMEQAKKVEEVVIPQKKLGVLGKVKKFFKELIN